MSGANTDLFVRVLAQIERKPMAWNQSLWGQRTDCGTTYCFAGWSLTLSPLGLVGIGWSPTGMLGRDDLDDGSVSDRSRIFRRARQLLGLSEKQAERLFSIRNTIDDLYRISAGLCNLDEQVLRDKVASEVADGRVQQ